LLTGLAKKLNMMALMGVSPTVRKEMFFFVENIGTVGHLTGNEVQKFYFFR